MSRSTEDRTEDRIAAAAARQHGVVTRAQLMEAGLSSGSVKSRLRSGRLLEIHRGIYLVGPLAPPGARAMAAVLATAPHGFVSHGSAARFWGLAHDSTGAGEQWSGGSDLLRRPDSEPIDITIVRVNRGRRPGIRVHRVLRLDADECAVVDRIPVTAPGRTIFDLADVIGSNELERVIARAEREGLVDRERMSLLLARYRGRKGVPALRAVLDAQGGPALTRSEAEARFLQLVRNAALPTPEANVAIGRYEIDFLWRKERIAVEVDGFGHHASRPRFEGDRRKDAWLLARGITVFRLSWRQIVNEAVATAVQVGQALARAAEGRSPGHVPVARPRRRR